MNLRTLWGLASPHQRAARIQLAALALGTLLSLNALAFNSSLQPEEIQEAYSLGQTSNHEELADFYSQYVHKFSYPANNPAVYVESVEFQTPYERIVSRSQLIIHYSKFQAAEDYQANPGLIIVKVETSLKLNYNGPEPPADGYKVRVYQASAIEPMKTSNNVTCDPYYTYNSAVNTGCMTYMREIILQFDAEQFARGAVNVRVQTPDGQTIQTKFDLKKLK